jgi:hypothetical protein
MPTIGHIGPFAVMIFRNDHDPPHFHVFGAEFSAKFAIDVFELLSVKGRCAVETSVTSKRGDKTIKANYTRIGGLPARVCLPGRSGTDMLCEITDAVAHPDHTVTITWSDGARGVVDFAPFIARGELFATLEEPAFFVREMRVLDGGIGLAWPRELDFSADGLRRDAFPGEPHGEYDEPTGAPAGT